MNGRKLALAGMLLAASTVSMGCHAHKLRGGSIAPVATLGTDGAIAGDGVLVGAPKSSFVDRHPLLYKPRDVYHTTAHHGVVKVMAATFVGVPAGVVCEVGQVINGCERCLP